MLTLLLQLGQGRNGNLWP